MNGKRAEMGVGTLIIFISLLLVAAVAAGVVIQTAGSLQQKALSTGSQATTQISTSAIALEVSAVDGTNPGGVTNFSMIMKLAAGSDPIKLDEVTLRFSTTSETITYTYRTPVNDSAYCGAGTTAEDCTLISGVTGNFTVNYLQQGANYESGILGKGDVISLYFRTTNGLDEGEAARIRFIPKTGVATPVTIDAPDVMSTRRVYLYPI